MAGRSKIAFESRFDRTPAAIVVKLGLHRGACIAVTTGEILDYFGATVNVAARLQGQGRGGDIVLSSEMIADGVVAGVLAAPSRNLNRP
jgi:class 3 adenylate cyclase